MSPPNARPARNPLLVLVVWGMANSVPGVHGCGGDVVRSWRAVDNLVHPYEEAITAHRTDCYDRPDAESQDDEYQHLPATPGAETLLAA